MVKFSRSIFLLDCKRGSYMGYTKGLSLGSTFLVVRAAGGQDLGWEAKMKLFW